MIRRRWSVGAIACVAAVSLAGCSGDAPSFDDLPALAKAVDGEGVPCDDVDPKRGSELVNEIGSCRGSEVTLYVFDSAEALDDWKKVAPLVAPATVGANWAATGDRAAVERIRDRVGGEITPAE